MGGPARPRCVRCCPTWTRRSTGWRDPATRTATATSSTSGRRRTAWPTRGGRTRATRSTSPTGRWPGRLSRCARCRATRMRRGSRARASHRPAMNRSSPLAVLIGRPHCASRSTGTSGSPIASVRRRPGRGQATGRLDRLEHGPLSVDRHRGPRASGRRGAMAHGSGDVERLGSAHAQHVDGALRPVQLPQRFGVAARHRRSRWPVFAGLGFAVGSAAARGTTGRRGQGQRRPPTRAVQRAHTGRPAEADPLPDLVFAPGCGRPPRRSSS